MKHSKDLPSLTDLKSITFDFENGECKVNDFNIGHCTDVSVVYQNGKWRISFGVGSDSITLIRKTFNN